MLSNERKKDRFSGYENGDYQTSDQEVHAQYDN